MKKFCSIIIALILFFPALLLAPILAVALAGIAGSLIFWTIILCLFFGIFVAFPILWTIFKLSVSIIAKLILSLISIGFFALGIFFIAFLAIL